MITSILALLLSLHAPAQDTVLANQVEIVRTAHGVPHIRAQNFKAAGYALGYVQLEDYGSIVPLGLIRARGEMARYFGRDSIESDFINQPNWKDAEKGYPLLDKDTRDMYDGFAAGVNAYIRKHRSELPAWVQPNFTGIDALTTDMELPDDFSMKRVLQRVDPKPPNDKGSNAWALAPSRTKSGKAILLRNPHLGWDAGYYEAQLTIPGVIDFYGDFRIGGPFQTIGGFNARLGWATTNNGPDIDEVYALTADPERADHILFDGASVPLRRELVTVAFRNGNAVSTETREVLHSPVGRVVHRANGKVYVWKYGGAGEYRLGQMWLRMMRAQNLEQWKDAMRMLAKPSSNFTYADADGNILYVWYGQVPRLPHASGGDTTAINATSSADVFTSLTPFDSLPQLLNPKGGYLHNENDPYHYTNLNEVLSESAFPAWWPRARLGLRSQHSLELIGGSEKFSLEDVVRLKHSPRMLLADRVKPDLLAALRAANVTGDAAAAADMLSRWDNTAAVQSRGGMLFELWWQRYAQRASGSAFRRPWSADDPTRTPEGISRPDSAVAAFTWAVDELKKRYGTFDVAWGDVNRVRYGKVDEPVAGCDGRLGCFRVLWLTGDTDGKRGVIGGDGWVIAVEFGKVPRAYSVLAYGQSMDPASANHDDQAAMFARGEMKKVLFTAKDVDRGAVKRYRPGLE